MGGVTCRGKLVGLRAEGVRASSCRRSETTVGSRPYCRNGSAIKRIILKITRPIINIFSEIMPQNRSIRFDTSLCRKCNVSFKIMYALPPWFSLTRSLRKTALNLVLQNNPLERQSSIRITQQSLTSGSTTSTRGAELAGGWTRTDLLPGTLCSSIPAVDW